MQRGKFTEADYYLLNYNRVYGTAAFQP